MQPAQQEARDDLMERVEVWFHLMLALALGTIIYVTASGAR